MYSDLLDVLGSQGAGGSGSSRNNDENNKHIALEFKAGRCNMALQENGKYLITPDTRRGLIRLVWQKNESKLKFEWYDRREKTVVDTTEVKSTVDSTFERIETGNEKERVYLWEQKLPEGEPKRSMYWMQDGTDEEDDEHVAKVNEYLTNPADANPNKGDESSGSSSGSGANASANTSTNAVDADTLMQVMQGVTASTAAGGSSSGSGGASGSQIDALSNILENLGMPQPSSSSSTTAAGAGGGSNSGAGGTSAGTATGSASAAASGTTGTLTLADLQGAMAGLATSTPPATPTVGPPLQDLVTPGAISKLLENDDVTSRLLSLLPENQQSKEYLEENLRSAQIQQTLRNLTQALLPDPDTGNLDGYHSIIANFQLDPTKGDESLRTTSNPIQAFLDCIISDAKKKKDSEKKEEETKDEEMKDSNDDEESKKKDDKNDDTTKDSGDTPKPMEE